MHKYCSKLSWLRGSEFDPQNPLETKPYSDMLCDPMIPARNVELFPDRLVDRAAVVSCPHLPRQPHCHSSWAAMPASSLPSASSPQPQTHLSMLLLLSREIVIVVSTLLLQCLFCFYLICIFFYFFHFIVFINCLLWGLFTFVLGGLIFIVRTFIYSLWL